MTGTAIAAGVAMPADDGWAIFALPAGTRDLALEEYWEASIERSRRRRAAKRRPRVVKGGTSRVSQRARRKDGLPVIPRISSAEAGYTKQCSRAGSGGSGSSRRAAGRPAHVGLITMSMMIRTRMSSSTRTARSKRST